LKICFFLFLLSLLISPSHAQGPGSEVIDSLKLTLLNATEDTNKVRLLGKLSFEYYQFDTDSGIYYAEKAIALSKKIKWELGVAFSYNYLGTNYAVKGNYPKALEYFNKSLSKYAEIGDKQGVAFLSNNLGNFYRLLKNYPKAIELTNKALALNKELGNKMELVKNFNNLGCAYSDLADFSKSNDTYELGLKIAEEINNKGLIARILINIAENKMKMRDYCKALELSIKALKISAALKITYDLAAYNSYVGEIYLKIFNEGGNSLKDCPYYSNDKQKNLIYAKEYLLSSINLLNRINDLAMISSNSKLLSEVYEKLGDSKNALHYFKKYSSAKDSVFSKDNSLKIAQLEKTREIELRDKQIEIQTLEIGKKKAQNVFQIVLFILILILISLVFYFYYKHKANKALRESEEKFRLIAENTSDGIAIFSAEKQLIYVSPAYVKQLGYDETYEFNRTSEFPYSNIHPDDRDDLYARLLNAISLKESGLIYSYRVRHKDGHYIWREDNAKFKYDDSGDYHGSYVVCRDISDRKKAEQELITAKNRAEESDRLKSAFLANMSHEIRTPMNGILGFAELLKEPNLTGEDQQKYIGIIEKSGDRMLNIISDIVSISKIESGQMEVSISETNVREKLETLYNLNKPEVDKKGLNLLVRFDLPLKESIVKTDGEKLDAILTNMIKNAIKYTKKGSIEFGCEKKDHYLEFFVKDTGDGINQQQKEIIFERFRQGSDLINKYNEGTGLGLSISKAYVEMLGGKIWVKSEEGSGSVFYFTIPFNPVLAEEIVPENISYGLAEEKQSKKLNILVAEDDETSEMFISIAVKTYGNEFFKAKTGAEAVALCRKNNAINLVLMDIRMPGMDGYEATRQIRQFNKEVVIIAQTAYGLTGDREKAIEAGCNDYISKPISVTSLRELIHKHFNQ